MDTDMENLADDAAAMADDGGEAERYEAAEAEADLLRDRLRLAVIKIATAEGRAPSTSPRLLTYQHLFAACSSRGLSCFVCAGRKAGMEVADPVVACVADLAFKTAGQPPWLHLLLHIFLLNVCSRYCVAFS